MGMPDPAPMHGLPPRAGVGFKLEHAAAILETRPEIGWLEIHPETYMVAGGPRHALLEAVRADWPLSFHGVGLSLGGASPPDAAHLAALAALVDRYRPAVVSEHLAWCAHGAVCFGDLLPVPATREALDTVCRNVERTQEALGRTILVENPSHYLRLPGTDAMPEPAFLAELARRTGCGLLVDVNNVTVSAGNLGVDAGAYVDALPAGAIGEIHLGGHSRDDGPAPLLIDDHAGPVSPPVWDLFRRLLARIGPRPALVEWDNAVPAWPVLHAEARKADRILESCGPTRIRAA